MHGIGNGKSLTEVQTEKHLLEVGDMLPEMLKTNQGFAASAAALVDAARSLLQVHADNGAVRFLSSLAPPAQAQQFVLLLLTIWSEAACLRDVASRCWVVV
jgi:hypothetical protein